MCSLLHIMTETGGKRIRESIRLMYVWTVSAFNIRFIKCSTFLSLHRALVPSTKQAEINLLCGRSWNRDVCVKERQRFA